MNGRCGQATMVEVRAGDRREIEYLQSLGYVIITMAIRPDGVEIVHLVLPHRPITVPLWLEEKAR